MRKREKIAFIEKTLQALFPEPKIPLEHKDPYTLLVATVLSAQCQDERVNQVTRVLFQKASTPEEMVALGIPSILTCIESLGLSSTKAKALWHLSKQLIDKHEGCVPATHKELEALRGVGHKTAEVVLGQAFGVATFPVDTHIHRLACRWGLSEGSSVEQTEKDLKRLFPKKAWAKLHLQMIYFGRTYCPARGHSVEACPICSALSA